MSAPPVTRMGLAPLLHAPHVLRTTKIIPVLLLHEPFLPACCLARLLAYGLGAVLLMPGITGVWMEEDVTVLARALSLSFYHWPALQGQSSGQGRGFWKKMFQKKRRRDHRRKKLYKNAFEEDKGCKTNIFMPAILMRFQVAGQKPTIVSRYLQLIGVKFQVVLSKYFTIKTR